MKLKTPLNLYIFTLYLWIFFFSTISGDKKEEDPDKTLNIFSVASGHMYERLMR